MVGFFLWLVLSFSFFFRQLKITEAEKHIEGDKNNRLTQYLAQKNGLKKLGTRLHPVSAHSSEQVSTLIVLTDGQRQVYILNRL